MAPLPLLSTISDDGLYTLYPRASHLLHSDAGTPARLRRDDLYAAIDSPISDISSLLHPRSETSPLNIDSTSIPQAGLLDRRQTYISNLPASYAGLNDGPSSGTIVGILLGVVLGYILLFWLILALINAKSMEPQYVEGNDTEIVVRRGHNSSRRTHKSHKSHRAPSTEASELPDRRHRDRDTTRTERIIVEETRRAGSRPPPPRSHIEETINISVRDSSRPPAVVRVPGDDVIEVEEEDTTSASAMSPDPAPRRKQTSGFRAVDPNAYAGGNYPRQEFPPPRSRSRRRG